MKILITTFVEKSPLWTIILWDYRENSRNSKKRVIMSSQLPVCSSSIQRNLYDQSVYYTSEEPKLLERMKEKALSMVPEAAKNQRWVVCGSSFVAKKIIDATYNEFNKLAMAQFQHPKFDFYLKCSVNNKYAYFYGELLDIVNEALQEIGVKKEYPPQTTSE
jgi:hypothetical protein